MAGWGVEREPRTVRLSASVVSTGVSPLMPPHSQGAERRREHRAGRTASRWGLRVLVVGGLTGVAWLLSGVAAQAADRDPPAEVRSLGSSLIGSVAQGGDQARPLVDRVLGAATTPSESGRRHGLGPATALPARLVGMLDEATHDSSAADSALGGVDGVVRELTATLRPSGEAVHTRQPATDLPKGTAAPARHTGYEVSAADAHEADTDRTGAGDAVADRPDSGTVAGEGVPAAERTLDRPSAVGMTVARQQFIAADRPPAAVRAAGPETVRDTPGGDGPAPLRVHLGAANGIPASGPGTEADGGSAAFLPAKVADSTTAHHRLPIATDVDVRRFDAEAPTVSPD
jgi:hypothetical protein